MSRKNIGLAKTRCNKGAVMRRWEKEREMEDGREGRGERKGGEEGWKGKRRRARAKGKGGGVEEGGGRRTKVEV